jgi:hypothetical protein
MAIETAPDALSDVVWIATLELLKGAPKVASRTAQNLSISLYRWTSASDELANHLDEALTVIEKSRSDSICHTLGFAINDCSDLLQEKAEQEILNVLRNHYHYFGSASQREVIKLYGDVDIPQQERNRFLADIIIKPLDRALKEEAKSLLKKSLPSLVGSTNGCLWHSWSEALNAQLPTGWDTLQAAAIGHILSNDRSILRDNEKLVRDLLKSLLLDTPQENIERYVIVIKELIVRNAETVANILLSIEAKCIQPAQILTLSQILLDIIRGIPPLQQQPFVLWSNKLRADDSFNLIPIFAVLSENFEDAQVRVIEIINNLPTERRPRSICKLLEISTDDTILALSEKIVEQLNCLPADKDTRLAWIDLYAVYSKTNPEVIADLCNIALQEYRIAALAASRRLTVLAGEYTRPIASDLFPLLEARFPGVRSNCLKALLKISDKLSGDEIIKACMILKDETDNAVLRGWLNLVGDWIVFKNKAPILVIDVIGELTLRMLQQNRIEGGAAKALIVTLKRIAQTAEDELPETFPQQVQEVLQKIDLRRVRDNGEAEAIDLVSAVARVYQTFLSKLIEASPTFPGQNIRTVIYAIQRTEGGNSNLLDSLLKSDSCGPSIKSEILKMRGV